jgi:hypothetical protein
VQFIILTLAGNVLNTALLERLNKMITKRGKRVRAVAIVLGIILIWQVSANLWWVGIDAPSAEFLGWCWGSMSQCVVL